VFKKLKMQTQLNSNRRKKMKGKLSLVLLLGVLFALNGVLAYDNENPYTVTVNFIVGDDTSFTVTLAGSETTIDFNPATKDSKEVEPDSQVAGSSTPIAEITNTGNVALNFTHKVTSAMPAFVAVSYNTANSVDWAKTITDEYSTISTAIDPASSSNLYMWANFTDADAGTTPRTYQINSIITSG